jgi:hypothetical protein
VASPPYLYIRVDFTFWKLQKLLGSAVTTRSPTFRSISAKGHGHKTTTAISSDRNRSTINSSYLEIDDIFSFGNHDAGCLHTQPLAKG